MGRQVVAGCGGMLIAHLDGAVAACTEELLGRRCTGSPHLEETTCETVLGPGGCEHCDVVFEAESFMRAAAEIRPLPSSTAAR